MKGSSAPFDPFQHLHGHWGNLISCFRISKAAHEVELKLPLAVTAFRWPRAVLARGNSVVLQEWAVLATRQSSLGGCFPSWSIVRYSGSGQKRLPGVSRTL